MLVAFRVDASTKIGNGHVVRCMTLAKALTERGFRCYFICSDHNGHLGSMITNGGFELILLKKNQFENSSSKFFFREDYDEFLGSDWFEDANQTLCALSSIKPRWLIVDHYSIDSRWEQYLSNAVDNIFVIDDLANRSHYCRLLMDQTLGRNVQDYDKYLAPGAVTLIGAEYSLLSPDFVGLRNASIARRIENSQLKQILISMGGVDSENVTEKVLRALESAKYLNDVRIITILGSHAPWLKQVKQYATRMRRRTDVLVDVNNMAHIMAESDLAIGATGGTAWERCCLGLPSLVFILAENQKTNAVALNSARACILMETAKQVAETIDKWESANQTSMMLKKLSLAASHITDGHGVARVTDALIELSHA